MAGHLRISQGSQSGVQAGVISNVPAGSVLLGSPAQTGQGILLAGGHAETNDPAAPGVTRAL